MVKRQSNGFTRAAIAAFVALALASCASSPARASWKTKSSVLPRGVLVELGPERDGVSAFRIRGDELEGATLKGEAKPEGRGWTLDVEKMDWFENWAEGWTEASFVVEGRLELRPDGSAWALAVAAPPKIENPTSASIRLYGDYFEGDKALALLAHRWDRIQAADELLRQEFPEAWYDYSEPHPIRFPWDLLARRVASFQTGVRAFLFPEIYGYPKGRQPADKGARVRAESIYWDTSYTNEQFPENLRPIRDSGTMYRDFEESSGLWRLDFCWDALWESKIGAAVFAEE